MFLNIHSKKKKPISPQQEKRVKNTQHPKKKKNYQQAFNLAHVLPVILNSSNHSRLWINLESDITKTRYIEDY